MLTYRIPARCGFALVLRRGQLLRVIDPEGEQVADVVTFSESDPRERLSNGRSFDYGGRIYFTTGHTLYSDRSNPMLTIVSDTVGRHDFLLTPCSREMFRIQYGVTGKQPNCLDNLAKAIARRGVDPALIPTPFNAFMNVDVLPDGGLDIRPPRSKAGDSITLRAEMELLVAVSAWAAGRCNNYRFKPVDIEVTDG